MHEKRIRILFTGILFKMAAFSHENAAFSHDIAYEGITTVILTAEQTKIECGDSVSIPQDVKDIVNKLLETAEYDDDESDPHEPWSAFAQWGASFASGATKEATTENLRWQLELEILSRRAVNLFDVF